MDPGPVLRTARLVLRPWGDEDLEHVTALNADPQVMAHFPAPLSPAESEALAGRVRAHFAQHGFGVWAMEIPGVAPFAGFVGLFHVAFSAPFTPAVEIGWRLAARHWGHGYVTEGARAALRFGFEQLGLEEIVSFTVAANHRSWRVMERIGMRRSPDEDFDHPRLPAGHPLARHILYRLSRAEWQRGLPLPRG